MAGMQRALWWGLTQFNIPEIWNEETGENVTVAIIDSGICEDSQDFTGRIISQYNAINDTNDVTDDFLHGTTCAGIIGGSGEELIHGIAPKCGLVIIKAKELLPPILDAPVPEIGEIVAAEVDERNNEIIEENNRIKVQRATSQIIYLIRAFEWILKLEKKVDIINISMSVPPVVNPEQAELLNILQQRIDSCIANQITIVGSSGNHRIPKFPGTLPNVISSNCLNINGNPIIRYFRSDHLSCSAPGSEVDFYPLFDKPEAFGVSFSTAFISGVLALSISKYKRLNPLAERVTPINVMQRIEGTAINVGNILCGRGRINVQALLDSPI